MTLSITASGNVSGTFANTFGDRTISDAVARAAGNTLTDGTGANEADLIWESYDRSLAATSEQIDLSGSLTDQYGAAVVFARIKSILIVNKSTTDGELLTVGGGANEFPLFVGATHQFEVNAGGFFIFSAPLATGKPVTAATADQLTIDSGAATITYDIVVIGASA